MRSQQQFHRQYAPRACAVARVQEQKQHKITMMVAYAIASAIIVLWISYLPTLMGSLMTTLNVVPTHLSSASDSVNPANKGDQLTSVPFNNRWNALGTMTIRTLGENGVLARAFDPTKDIQPIPVGCEPAFSQLDKTGNLSARCVSSTDTKLSV